MITSVPQKDLPLVLEVLRAHMTYADLPEQILQELAGLLERQYVRKGEFVFLQGDSSTHMHMVERGRVVVTKSAPSGASIISYIATRGASLNAITCFKGQPRFFSAQAMEDTILLRTTTRDFVQWVSRNPEVAVNVLATMSDLLGGAFNRISDLAHESVEQRVLNALAMLAVAARGDVLRV